MFSLVKTVEREQARWMRQHQGRSVKEIAGLLGVARSTASAWVRDIELSPEQRDALADRVSKGQFAGSASNARLALARWHEAQDIGRARARDCKWRYVAGCMLCWAEGSRSRHAVQFTNSDPDMMRFFIEFLRDDCDVPSEKFRVACNLFADHDERRQMIEDFWLELLGLPRAALTKTMVNRYSKWSAKKRKNKLPYGTCRLTVHDTRLAHILYGSIQELGGFERAAWLDLPY
jgi:transcriptional regulator with XRE-family HTH domain